MCSIANTLILIYNAIMSSDDMNAASPDDRLGDHLRNEMTRHNRAGDRLAERSRKVDADVDETLRQDTDLEEEASTLMTDASFLKNKTTLMSSYDADKDGDELRRIELAIADVESRAVGSDSRVARYLESARTSLGDVRGNMQRNNGRASVEDLLW
jgi:hypothetical protein